MIAHITSDQWIYFDNITAWEESILQERFSASHPNRRFIDDSSTQTWDGVYRKYSRAHKRLARPFLGELRGLCKKKDLSLVVVDDREPAKYKPIDINLIDENFLPGITLKKFQVDAIKRIYRSEVGVFHSPVSSGKSEIIAGICKAMQCPTVIIAEQIVVIDQLRQRLMLRDVCDEPGLFYAGKMPSGQLIIIGSIQSLLKPSKKPTQPQRNNYKREAGYQAALKKYAIKLKAFKSRVRKAEVLHKLIGKTYMLLVDECVHEDTWINTSCGVMRAKVLYDLVCTGHSIMAKVGTNFYPIIAASAKLDSSTKIITNTRRELICSDNHPIATFCGFRKDISANELKTGDLILTPRGQLPSREVTKHDIWYHLGLFIGDGHLSNGQQVKFGVRKDKSDWLAIGKAVAEIWAGQCSSSTNCRGDLVIRIHARAFCDWLNNLGFKPGRKMGSIIPQFIIPDTAAAIGIIRGLFDSEGSNYGYRATFASTDLALVDFVQALLSYLGVGSSRLAKGARKSKKHKICYKLLVVGENYVKFNKLIGFGFSRKQMGMNYRNTKDSERYINPRPYILSWLDSGIKKKCLYRLLEFSLDSRSNYISLKRLIGWQKLIIEYCSNNSSSYREAREKLGLSYEKIGRFHSLSTMTAWNKVTKQDLLWREYAEAICDALCVPIVDTTLEDFAVERIDTIEHNDKNSRLLDFKVLDAASFEANGFLVHNCDLATSSGYKDLFRYRFNGRRRYGFTGTLNDKEKPVQTLVLQEHLGSVIFKCDADHIEKEGLAVPLEYYALVYGEDGSRDDATAYDIAYNETIVYNQSLHKIFAAICRRYEHEGTLILVDRDDLGYALRDLIPHCKFIHGKTPRDQRIAAIAEFERRELRVLIGGKNVRRGMDLKNGCENLILATGGKLDSDFAQRTGRARRINQKGRARVFDIFFLCNKYLYAHSRKRLKAACNMGLKTKVIFRDGIIDGAAFVRSRFRRPKFNKVKVKA